MTCGPHFAALDTLDRFERKCGLRVVVTLCIFAVTVFCVFLWKTGDERLVQSYATDAAGYNRAMASRLCGSGRRAVVLYGVFSTADKVLWRNATRQQVQCHFNSEMHSTVFVVGAARSEREHHILRTEAAMYGDIFTLSCTENMNRGKSYTYFKEALEYFPCFNFYAKVDDDTAWVPARLSRFIQSETRSTPVMIGRHESFPTIHEPFFWIERFIRGGLRDISWTRHMEDYCAGMLYVLNTAAVRMWVALGTIDVSGDEDMRTFYYMKKIGAEVVNTHRAFHDHMRQTAGVTEWCENITNTSLAVHGVKAIDLLTETFASLCTERDAAF
jgi:hypothetical protein